MRRSGPSSREAAVKAAIELLAVQCPPGEAILFGGVKDDEGVTTQLVIYFAGPQSVQYGQAALEAFSDGGLCPPMGEG